jgi:hypothetical protein
MRKWFFLMGGPLFLMALSVHVWVRLHLRPPDDLDDVYYEFEEQHQGYARYSQWLKATVVIASFAALLLFLGVVF